MGALERIFAASVGVALIAFGVWFLFIEGPGRACWRRRVSVARVGLLDYYRQFEDLDELALNRERRARQRRERRLALEQLPDLDLSGTEWPDLPHLGDRERGHRSRRVA